MDELKVKVNFENPVQVQAVQIPGLPGRDGRDGTPGKNGENGRDGKSAYEVAVDNGFVGTVDEWLESLKCRDGASGTSEAVSMNFPRIKNMLDVRAINADSDSLEDILRAIVKEVVPDGDYSNHLAEFTLVNEKVEVGSTTVEIIGQPHFFITEQDHRNVQQIPAGGRLTFTLSAPFNGEEKQLDVLYPDISKGTYSSITIPQNVAEQVIQDDTQGATGAKLYLNSQGKVCIRTRTYESLADVFKWSYWTGHARQYAATLTIDCYERGTAIKADGLTALNQHFKTVNCIDEWPSHVEMPNQSQHLFMNLNIARSKGDADLVQNDLSQFECQGQQLDVTDGRLEYVHL